MRRPNLLVALGAVLVLVGIGLAWAVGRDTEADATEQRRPVLVAVEALEPGQAGEDVVAAGRVEVVQVPTSDVAPGALTSPAELTGTIIGSRVEPGGQVVGAALRSSVLRGSSFEIPDGQEAVAVTVPFTSGVAGYAGPGDRVNLYVSIRPDSPGAPTSPRTELLLPGIEVLDVSDEVAPRRADPIASTDGAPTTQPSRVGAEQITLLLAVTPEQAEQVVFASTNNDLWFSLVPEDGARAETPGVDYGTYGPAEAAS